MKITENDWSEYLCVKIVSQGATTVSGYDDFVPMGKQIQPQRSDKDIMWKVTFRNGKAKTFKIKVK